MGISSLDEKIKDYSKKIDDATTLGLAGTSNSLSYRVHEIEKHFHSPEVWRGKLTVQTATAWADDTLSPYRAISGSNDYGGDADDEALVLGTADTPVQSGYVKYDLHQMLFTELSTDTPFKIRIIWGTGTMADAITAGQCSEIIIQNNPTGNKVGGSPLDVMMPRLNSGVDKVWIQAWNATDNATADFLVGFHEYSG